MRVKKKLVAFPLDSNGVEIRPEYRLDADGNVMFTKTGMISKRRMKKYDNVEDTITDPRDLLNIVNIEGLLSRKKSSRRQRLKPFTATKVNADTDTGDNGDNNEQLLFSYKHSLNTRDDLMVGNADVLTLLDKYVTDPSGKLMALVHGGPYGKSARIAIALENHAVSCYDYSNTSNKSAMFDELERLLSSGSIRTSLFVGNPTALFFDNIDTNLGPQAFRQLIGVLKKHANSDVPVIATAASDSNFINKQYVALMPVSCPSSHEFKSFAASIAASEGINGLSSSDLTRLSSSMDFRHTIHAMELVSMTSGDDGVADTVSAFSWMDVRVPATRITEQAVCGDLAGLPAVQAIDLANTKSVLEYLHSNYIDKSNVSLEAASEISDMLSQACSFYEFKQHLTRQYLASHCASTFDLFPKHSIKKKLKKKLTNKLVSLSSTIIRTQKACKTVSHSPTEHKFILSNIYTPLLRDRPEETAAYLASRGYTARIFHSESPDQLTPSQKCVITKLLNNTID